MYHKIILSQPDRLLQSIADKHLALPIYHPKVIRIERQRSKQTPTIAFDIDGTIVSYNQQSDQHILRPGIRSQLDILKSKGVRLVIWTSRDRHGSFSFFLEHPDLLQYFDMIITYENIDTVEILRQYTNELGDQERAQEKIANQLKLAYCYVPLSDTRSVLS